MSAKIIWTHEHIILYCVILAYKKFSIKILTFWSMKLFIKVRSTLVTKVMDQTRIIGRTWVKNGGLLYGKMYEEVWKRSMKASVQDIFNWTIEKIQTESIFMNDRRLFMRIFSTYKCKIRCLLSVKITLQLAFPFLNALSKIKCNSPINYSYP